MCRNITLSSKRQLIFHHIKLLAVQQKKQKKFSAQTKLGLEKRAQKWCPHFLIALCGLSSGLCTTLPVNYTGYVVPSGEARRAALLLCTKPTLAVHAFLRT